MNKLFLFAAGILTIGLAAGYGIARLAQTALPKLDVSSDTSRARKVVYWVAPMDPNFRRDKPGKSPMGMDLIPVYEGETPGSDSGEPGIRIDPAVINNIGVQTDLVKRGAFHRQISTVGFIVPNDNLIGHVHVRTEGWIEELAVKTVGETVEKGDLLFRFYSPDLVSAQAEFLQARKQGRDVITQAVRARLMALGMAPQQIADLTESGEIRQLTDVYAHHSGTVLILSVREGNHVKPEDMIMDMADLSSVWILAEVFEDEASWVKEGKTVVMTLPAIPGEIWKGAVDYVYPTVDPKSRTVQVRLVFDNPDRRLKPNMYVNVEIEAATKPDVLTIPQSALIRSSKGGRVILALGEGRFRPAQVVAGMESGDEVEILDGLKAGERIVTASQFLIDSEASLDASLLRLKSSIDSANSSMPDMAGMEMPEPTKPAIGTGRVKSVDAPARKIVLDHEPIPELGWPSMTMEFELGKGVPLETVQVGVAIRFDVRKTETGYELLNVHPVTDNEAAGDSK